MHFYFLCIYIMCYSVRSIMCYYVRSIISHSVRTILSDSVFFLVGNSFWYFLFGLFPSFHNGIRERALCLLFQYLSDPQNGRVSTVNIYTHLVVTQNYWYVNSTTKSNFLFSILFFIFFLLNLIFHFFPTFDASFFSPPLLYSIFYYFFYFSFYSSVLQYQVFPLLSKITFSTIILLWDRMLADLWIMMTSSLQIHVHHTEKKVLIDRATFLK